MTRLSRRIVHLLAIALLGSVLLAGCGQKGDLYHPDTAQQKG
jgi:predicted small lipoprotein YifL